MMECRVWAIWEAVLLTPQAGAAELHGGGGGRAWGGEFPLLIGDEFRSKPRSQTMSGSLGFQGALSQALAEVCSILSGFGVHCKPEENKAKRNANPTSSMQDRDLPLADSTEG